LREDITIINVFGDFFGLSAYSIQFSGVLSARAASALLALLLQVHMIVGTEPDLLTYLIKNSLLESRKGKPELQTGQISAALRHLLDSNLEKRWVFFFDDFDSLSDDVVSELGKFLGGLLEGFAGFKAGRVRIAIVGGEPRKVPAALSRHTVVVTQRTEYLGMWLIFYIENCRLNQDRMLSRTSV